MLSMEGACVVMSGTNTFCAQCKHTRLDLPESIKLGFCLECRNAGFGKIPASPCEVNSPKHYTATAVEPIDAIEAWELNYRLGNVVKYIARHKLKHDDPLRDLRKAKWYLDREIQKLEAIGAAMEAVGRLEEKK